MERRDRFALAVIVGGSILTASVVSALTFWHAPVSAAPQQTAAQLAAARTNVHPLHETLVIANGDQLDDGDMPAYMPAALTLPANSTVTITVINFDDPTPLAAGAEKFATATGILGPMQVQALDTKNPNDTSAPVTKTMSLDPQNGVSHTFTITKLGINVPIPPASRVTFTIHTGKAGTYTWQCYDPCGGDPNGWGGAMSDNGYMRGTLTIV